MAKVGSEYLLIQQLEFKDSCALKIESSGNESDWNNEGFELELNNAYNIMQHLAPKKSPIILV
ncbi:7634_t:CDS:2 [Racocetra fulgida]|uniref:7634_t:CDS:1 n=1 Tax=Racocetra fulgida TaxID=60492 RepID=A0A9N9BHL9_9GLOM|nr:7634_t:CDS:2 [Racocetra fulgida]